MYSTLHTMSMQIGTQTYGQDIRTQTYGQDIRYQYCLKRSHTHAANISVNKYANLTKMASLFTL